MEKLSKTLEPAVLQQTFSELKQLKLEQTGLQADHKTACH